MKDFHYVFRRTWFAFKPSKPANHLAHYAGVAKRIVYGFMEHPCVQFISRGFYFAVSGRFVVVYGNFNGDDRL